MNRITRAAELNIGALELSGREPPWTCGWCDADYRGKPSGATRCQAEGCKIPLCERCAYRCVLCAETRCYEHAVFYDDETYCAVCAQIERRADELRPMVAEALRREAEHERLLAELQAVPAGFLHAALGGVA